MEIGKYEMTAFLLCKFFLYQSSFYFSGVYLVILKGTWV
jgi:hypothetical protein